MNTRVRFLPETQQKIIDYAWLRTSKSEGYRDSIDDENKLGIHDPGRQRIDIVGVAAEAACAKVLGVTYEHLEGTFGAPDIVLPNKQAIQVKGTEYANGHLIIKGNRDPARGKYKDEPYVLVYVKMEGLLPIRARVIGWILSMSAFYFADTDGFWRDAKEGYERSIWVPQDFLAPITSLVEPVVV